MIDAFDRLMAAGDEDADDEEITEADKVANRLLCWERWKRSAKPCRQMRTFRPRSPCGKK